MRVPGLEERRLEDHQLPRQARTRLDGPLRDPAQGHQARRPARLRPGRVRVRRVGIVGRQAGVPPQADG
ncbi:hypothetical protein G6F59_018012 [Rhizopus arrhizus]|nr:hypothetical protein G6F59_018012 [Rhizopus arrhizus]